MTNPVFLFDCFQSCVANISSGRQSVLINNESYDLDCISQCSSTHTQSFADTSPKYTLIIQIISVVLITFGLFGKVFNCIIFLRKPLRGTSTGLLLLLKTIFDTLPLLCTFVFDTKFFLNDEQINSSQLICLLARSSDIFVSWSIGFVLLCCLTRVITIVHSTHLPQCTRLRVFSLIIFMMICGACYNWHVFYYKSLQKHKDEDFTYCNVIFGRQIGYFSFNGFEPTNDLLYNAPIVNFVVSSLIPFTIVAITNIIIIKRVLKSPSTRLSKVDLHRNGAISSSSSSKSSSQNRFSRSDPNRSSLRHIITKKDVSYETTITLTTSCVFLTTNSIASIYVYVKTSKPVPKNIIHDGAKLTEDVKTSNVYLILRMLTLLDTVLEFYIYFITGRKFRKEFYHVIREILQHSPLRKYFKFKRPYNTGNTSLPIIRRNKHDKNVNSNGRISQNETIITSKLKKSRSIIECDERQEMIDRIESTV
ncbi:unnamed protein product [Didymodactylos carnosus]|uniref:G-protein coupled receptors family 1 profile domain-containing protein n=1 Tax=Didymodactylos carnosus TaxID=1234261 RepID=A0A813YKS8_9BILA|nr:unnamed protein product [Didymodactylos carnosus]CAF3671001.1 unnamed protein product [Didymodactylos carnosus]